MRSFVWALLLLGCDDPESLVDPEVSTQCGELPSELHAELTDAHDAWENELLSCLAGRAESHPPRTGLPPGAAHCYSDEYVESQASALAATRVVLSALNEGACAGDALEEVLLRAEAVVESHPTATGSPQLARVRHAVSTAAARECVCRPEAIQLPSADDELARLAAEIPPSRRSRPVQQSDDPLAGLEGL